MLVTAKKPTFGPGVRNSTGSLQTMSERFTEACNAVPAEVLYNFARYPKRQTIPSYNKASILKSNVI